MIITEEDFIVLKIAVESFVQTRFNLWKERKIHTGDFVASVAPVLDAFQRLEGTFVK